MPDSLQTLCSFVPSLVRGRFARAPALQEGPVAERFDAAVVLMDIAGFTALTERLAELGPIGAEKMTAMINAYMGELVALVYTHGGDVVKFAGDALLALWPATDEDLQSATRRSLQCALQAQERLHDYATDEGVRLRMRIGIGAGAVQVMHLGGIAARWELVVGGTATVQSGQAKDLAEPGAVAVSTQAWEMVAPFCEGAPSQQATGRIVLRVHTSLPTRETATVVVPPEAEQSLRAYVPSAILSRLDAGLTGWIAELRRVTILFVKLPAMDMDEQNGLAQAQRVMQALQAALYRYGGVVNKLSVDDKGPTLLAALGVPPVTYEDDPVRAVLAAQAMLAELSALGLSISIGITTGRAFCGAVGALERREYTVMGDVVNSAARLMMHAQGSILCDAPTRQFAGDRITFEELPAIAVKGKAEPVPIGRPLAQSRRESRRVRQMVGRQHECEVLAQRLQALQSGESSLVVIEGEPGIGKSQLIAHAAERAKTAGICLLSGAGDAIEQSTPLYAWRTVFGAIFALESIAEQEERHRSLLQQLDAEPHLLRLAPLLSSVLPVELLDNELTMHMTQQVRIDNTHELLSGILQREAERRSAMGHPLMLVIEDAQWQDSAAWGLLHRVMQQVRPLLLVVATRPMSDPPPADYLPLLQAPGLIHLKLGALPATDTLALLAIALGVRELPALVGELILQRAEGNPFFSEQLAYALRDNGLIVIEAGECRTAPGIDLREVLLPDTIQGVITSRLDRLAPGQQLALKVASVIGRAFAFRILRDMYPLQDDKTHLPEYMTHLEVLEMTRAENTDPDMLVYMFKHVITQEVTYNLMLYAQRRQLHRNVAEWYERTYRDDLTHFYPLLAYHWGKSEVLEKALQYLELAGAYALRTGAYRESARFFQEALTLGTNEPIARKARWEQGLGTAMVNMGQWEASRTHLERAAAWLQWPVAKRIPVGILGQLLVQTLHRFGLQALVRPAASAQAGVADAAVVYGQLAKIYPFFKDTSLIIYAALRRLNLAEYGEATAELALAYGTMCFAASMIPLHKLATLYLTRAKEVAIASGDVSAQAGVTLFGALRSFGLGQPEATAAALLEVRQTFERLGAKRPWLESSALYAILLHTHGDLRSSQALYDAVYEEAAKGHDQQIKLYSLGAKLLGMLAMGRSDEALPVAQEVLDQSVVEGDMAVGTAYAWIALARLMRGEKELAWQAADQATPRIPAMRFMGGFATPTLMNLAELYLRLWEESATNAPERHQHTAFWAKKMVAKVKQHGRIFPVGKPIALLYQGWADYLSGKTSAAMRGWQRCVAEAQRLQMVLEEGLAHYHIGRHLPPTDTGRRAHLMEAHRLLAQAGAGYHLRLVEQELEAQSV